MHPRFLQYTDLQLGVVSKNMLILSLTNNLGSFCSKYTDNAQPEETGKVGYWATGLLSMIFYDPYCNTGSFINEGGTEELQTRLL